MQATIKINVINTTTADTTIPIMTAMLLFGEHVELEEAESGTARNKITITGYFFCILISVC